MKNEPFDSVESQFTSTNSRVVVVSEKTSNNPHSGHEDDMNDYECNDDMTRPEDEDEGENCYDCDGGDADTDWEGCEGTPLCYDCAAERAGTYRAPLGHGFNGE
mgnify:CR=1 FL=1